MPEKSDERLSLILKFHCDKKEYIYYCVLSCKHCNLNSYKYQVKLFSSLEEMCINLIALRKNAVS